MKNTFTIAQGFKALLLAGGASTIVLATPAMAQDQSKVDCNAHPDDPSCASATPIVVTGTRIRSKDFQSNSPIVTVNDQFLKDSSSTAIENSLDKLPQFVPSKTPTQGGDIQPTATNTPGSATISLRGIGANRTLVLIDGRRATPSNASMVVDISTIPSAAIERIETISGGASATYGADAVAGVTNFILKKNFQGLELDGQASMSEHGDGLEYQISGIMGADFADGRGNVSIAMSTNQRDASYQRDRSWYIDLWNNPNTAGSGFFIDRPGINFGFGNTPDFSTAFPAANPAVPALGTTVYLNTDGSIFTGTSFPSRGGTAYFNEPTGGASLYKITAAGTIAANDTYLYLNLPLTRYNFLARGNYEINDWIGVFAQGMYSHVHTETTNEPGPIFAGWGVNIDPTVDVGDIPASLQSLLDSRPNPTAPFTLTALMPENRSTFTDVSTYNMIAGFEGSVPGTDWTWELYVNHGQSETYAIQTGVYSLSRLKAVLQAPHFGKGFSQTGNPENFGFGASTGTCTSGLNFFNPPAGGFSQDCLDAIRADLKNRSAMRQTIVEFNAQGKLLDLPAGELRAAVGADYRENKYDFNNDTLTTQGTSFQDQALGIYPSGDSHGLIHTSELYGELLVPLIHDTPGIQQLNLEIGGRMSDYNTTGTSYTYKALGDWQVNDWIRFRGGYNRAERAPNIGELYLAAQQTFGVNTAGDPCSTANPTSFSANPATNPNAANVLAICQALMDQTGDPNAKTFYYSQPQSNSTFGFAFPTLVGNPNLTPETADTWTAGVVLSSPFDAPALRNLRLSVDWYSISVNHAIGAQSVAIALQQCFDPALNPLAGTDPTAASLTDFCQHVPRNSNNGGLGNVSVTYVNNGRFKTSGIDVQLDWSAGVGPGTLSANFKFNYLLNFKSASLPTMPLVDYAGTFGTTDNGLNLGAFRYKIYGTLNYSVGPVNIGLNWQHLPSVEDSTEALFHTPTTGAPSYDLFGLTGSYTVTDNLKVRFGVDNLFNKAPPLTGINTANTDPATNGLLPGGSYQTLFYDTFGRSFYLGANIKF